jgi:hypothetical protein
MLIERQTHEQSQPAEVLSEEFLSYLSRKDALHRITLPQLIYMSFLLGYYYHVFITKNKVEYEPTTHDGTNETVGKPVNPGTPG